MDHDMNDTRSRSVPSTTGEITVSEEVDMEPADPNNLDNDDHVSLPDLMELSDSSEPELEQPSVNEGEPMMQAVDEAMDRQNAPMWNASYRLSAADVPNLNPFPTLPAVQPSSRSNNRRARVEDDEDEDRDRRHPSQRVSSSISNLSSNSSSISQTPPSAPTLPQPSSRPNTRIRTTLSLPSLARMGLDQADPLRFFQHLMPQQPHTQQNETNIAPTPINNNPAATLQPNRPASSAASIPQAPQNQPHGNDNESESETMALFTEMVMRIGALGALFGSSIGIEPEPEDPERAKKLIDGLEEVPIGLVRRLARIGGTDDADGSRDTMCAICWDQLLDEAGFGKKPATDDVSPAQSDTSSSQTTEPSIPEEQPEEHKQPKVVSLPCAHVFHADCLIPWFSRPRQTTCPTCRFNIDPENLTRTRRPMQSTPMQPAQTNAPADAPQTGQQPATDINLPPPPTNSNTDNTNPPHTGNGNFNNGRRGPFLFGGIPVPIVVAAPPIISSFPDTGNGGVNGGTNPIDDVQDVPNGFMEQMRARMEERLNNRAGHGNQRPSPDTNGPAADISPPTQPSTIPPPGPQLQLDHDQDQGATHSIIFGFDVRFGSPRTEGNIMGVDGRAGNGAGRDGDQNWLGMMMQDFERNRNDASAADTDTLNDNDPNRNIVGQEHSGVENVQNRTGARGQGQGISRFLNMNFGDGDSVHIASGMGRTMDEAMTHLLSSMANTGNQGPANTNANGNIETDGNAAQNDGANSEAAEPPVNGPSDENRQGQPQNQQNQEGGMFANMAVPFQMVAQMFGFGSQVRVRRRQSRDQGQPSNQDNPAASQGPQAGDNVRAPGSDTPHPEQGTAPQPNDNAADGDEVPFARFFRSMMAGNTPMPDGAMGGQTNDTASPPHTHLFPPGPPGFANRMDSQSPTHPNTPQPQKRQWAPPAAPGPTLRERIEKREREVGLRCCDMSCGVGPSDDDPSIVLTTEGMKQLTLRPANVDGIMCPHTFHPSCLVSAERVALRGADAPIVGDDVEVSCSVCRAVGRVSKRDWEEGIQCLT